MGGCDGIEQHGLSAMAVGADEADFPRRHRVWRKFQVNCAQDKE
ncbi:hypothetical protein [Sodalis sp.]